MSPKPTLVFVPGAWHSASTWDKVTSLLETYEYKCISVPLPSTFSDPSATFYADMKAVRDAIEGETTQGRDVVVVVHSYGGLVGVSAIKGLTVTKEETSTSTKDQSGHVIGVIMMATGFAITGMSFLDGAGGKPPPIWKANEETGFAEFLVDPRPLFYHDLPEEEGKYWVSQLKNHSLKSLAEGGEHVYAGWKDVPVWFLATTEDKAFPPPAAEIQRMFVQKAKDEGGDVTLREIASSHSPMLSMPKETVDFILEALKAFEA
ncbi:hypothetical protein EG329_006322 [Mollisiaceae sp. DMI_Dod_QoI]|nr:hypothetical protein EG329_006322 [Helotiales sp. DMI_Dod_QoI]